MEIHSGESSMVAVYSKEPVVLLATVSFISVAVREKMGLMGLRSNSFFGGSGQVAIWKLSSLPVCMTLTPSGKVPQPSVLALL